MPTLRQKVDSFCKDSGSKVGETDKLRNQVGMLKQELKKLKATHKHELHLAKAAAKTAKVKAAPKAKTLKAPKVPKIKQEVQMKPLPAQAEPMMPAPAAPPSLAPAAQPKGGRTRRRRPVMRW
jgi:CHAD domain-containing protein